MNQSNIYWASIEYRYNKNSYQFGKLLGGFVYGFVKAFDAKEALKKFKEALEREGIRVQKIEFISKYDIQTKWESEAQENRYIDLYSQSKGLQIPVFDDFYAFEIE